MKPGVGFLRALYRRLLPYDLRLRLWATRRRISFSPDKAPRLGAPVTERYAVRLIGKKALATSRFAQAIVQRTAALAPGHTMLRTWVEYPLGTNERGDAAVRAIQRHINVVGARQLDIGCAYGGTPIAFARAGAEAYGVEIDPGLLELARLNLADHPGAQCTLLVGNILQPELADGMGQFDIITCDNVIEHVEKASQLVATVARLLTASGVCQMGIPNPFSYLEVARDGHYGLFGLTLLERDRAIAYYSAAGNTDSYGVGEYCFTLADYVAMFGDAGLSVELMNPMPYDRAEVEALGRRMSGMPEVFTKHVNEQTIPAEVQDEVRIALDRYLAQFRSRYAAYRAASDPTKSALLGGHMLNDYQQGQWQVLARHTQASA